MQQPRVRAVAAPVGRGWAAAAVDGKSRFAAGMATKKQRQGQKQRQKQKAKATGVKRLGGGCGGWRGWNSGRMEGWAFGLRLGCVCSGLRAGWLEVWERSGWEGWPVGAGCERGGPG